MADALVAMVDGDLRAKKLPFRSQRQCGLFAEALQQQLEYRRVDSVLELEARRMADNPADVRIERFEPLELDQHLIADVWPIDQLDLAAIGRKVVDADAIAGFARRAESDFFSSSARRSKTRTCARISA